MTGIEVLIAAVLLIGYRKYRRHRRKIHKFVKAVRGRKISRPQVRQSMARGASPGDVRVHHAP
jgi:hypothetical protein